MKSSAKSKTISLSFHNLTRLVIVQEGEIQQKGSASGSSHSRQLPTSLGRCGGARGRSAYAGTGQSLVSQLPAGYEPISAVHKHIMFAWKADAR